jgi:Biopolymer transport protein
MRRRHFPDSEVDSGGVNLTPLIDVVFVVLILFILIAPMLELEKVQLASGSSKGKQSSSIPTENTLTLHVKEDNTILVNRRPVGLEELLPVLQAFYAKNPRLIPQLFHDKRAYFGTYQSVKNSVESSGI